ncbi:MAG TPA: hypothetical protein VH420_02435 [Gaiellaceae bacterium]|jgi:hypothetical protein
MRIHRVRTSLALVIAVGLFSACGGNDATDSTTTSAAAVPPSTAETGQQSFVSDLYPYSVDSWAGTSARTAWDGTGSPGDGDATVDSLTGPASQLAFGFSAPTKVTLKKFVATFRVTDSKVHPCPVKPEATKRATIAGEPAIVDEKHCPAGGGPFVLSAFTTHAGHVFVFFTYDQPGKEVEMRDWFRALVKAVSFRE